MTATNGHKTNNAHILGPPLPKLRDSGARLLALDGGGVKGVSPLTILDTIMDRVRDIEIKRGTNPSREDRKPVDYFDLAGGTSTGGLIALMLFRLRMSTKQVLTQYHELANDVFAPRLFGVPFRKPGIMHSLAKRWMFLKMLLGAGGIYNNTYLKTAIDGVVAKSTLPGDQKLKGRAPLVHPDAGMMFMCTTLAAKGESILMRSYPQPEDARPVTKWARLAAEQGFLDTVDIQTAALATSAAPFFLPQVPWNPGPTPATEMIFWDGGMLNNNPVDQLWSARYDLVTVTAPAPPVRAVLSLGCSFNTPENFKLTVSPIVRLMRAIGFITNTDAKAYDFEHYVQRMTDRGDVNAKLEYFRIDVDTGRRVFEMDDANSMNDLQALTEKWLQRPEIKAEVEAVAELLAK